MYLYTGSYPAICNVDGTATVYDKVVDGFRVIYKEHEQYAKENFPDRIFQIPGDAPCYIEKRAVVSPETLNIKCKQVKHLVVVK
jgi:hypothetical protein